ncbi:MAG TPA: hypothetical protein VIY29_00280, partial [Ktedonobacteraceae bacterium]
VHPIAQPPPAWAHIVCHGMASWMQQTHPEREAPKPFSQRARLDSSKLLTIVAAMIAEVCQ